MKTSANICTKEHFIFAAVFLQGSKTISPIKPSTWRSRTYFSWERAPLISPPDPPAPARPWHERPRALWPDLPALPCPRWARTCRPPGTPCGSAAPPPAPSPWCPWHPPGPAPPGTACWGARPTRTRLTRETEAGSAGPLHAPPLAGTRPQLRGQPASQLLVSRLPAPRFPAHSPRFPAPLARLPAARGAVGAQGLPGVVVPGSSRVMAAAGRPGPGGVPVLPVASGHSIPVLGLGKWRRARPEPASLPEALWEGGGHPGAQPGRLGRFGAALGPQPDSPQGSPSGASCRAEPGRPGAPSTAPVLPGEASCSCQMRPARPGGESSVLTAQHRSPATWPGAVCRGLMV